MIKLIALDLDGTTLNKKGKLSQGNRRALQEAADKGVAIVIATGRPFVALPQDIIDFELVRYVLTSNGARIFDLQEGKSVYENCLQPHSVEAAVKLLENTKHVLETFVDGVAYIEGWYYRQVQQTRVSFKNVDYILNTRCPQDDFYQFMLDNSSRIENINVNFEDTSEKPEMKLKLEALPDVTITSSFDHNLEIGGKTTSKAEALRQMCKLLDVKLSEVMAVGDSPNDISMLEEAGIAVAVANAKPEIKAMADYIAPDHDQDGVADAIYRYTGMGKDR
ncbi:MAG: HAD family hydrolase [Eubacteriales bacterium]|nr:HAD family hydrolase [Eubacteriales bacterium]